MVKAVVHKNTPSPLASSRERLAVWRKVRGMWKHRKQDPIQELHAMRREWERPAAE